MAPKSKAEKQYLKTISQYKEHLFMAGHDSPVEGFEYFDSKAYKDKQGSQSSVIKSMFFSNGLSHLLNMAGILFKYMKPMMRGRTECFTDLKAYFDELSGGQGIEKTGNLLSSFPNEEVWDSLKSYCREKWAAEIGFTELDERMIFKGKGVLFPYVLIVMQEMDKDKIDQAPGIEAGGEVQRVYNTLGHAANDIARWLRREYGIKCQSNHPLGGLVNTTPLAGKAGMGWQGMDGLLISPRFGKRHRIAPVFLQEKVFGFTDHSNHRWIEDFCRQCQKCRKNCPTGAIYENKMTAFDGVAGIGAIRTCIDREKCFPQFSRTLGCSICINSCPFSRGPEAYEKIRKSFVK